jgi:hypothetical protein
MSQRPLLLTVGEIARRLDTKVAESNTSFRGAILVMRFIIADFIGLRNA